MATYLDLVNKVVLESGKEQDQLTAVNWDSLDAGRRIYPRIKRLVKESWRAIQMSRNEWEFNTAELNATVYPRVRYSMGDSVSGLPVVGSEWVGRVSNTRFTLREITLQGGDWVEGTAYGQMEFDVVQGSFIELAEVFDSTVPGGGTFVYLEKGSYDFMDETDGRIREPHWTTFVAGRGTAYPNAVAYIPWDNFTYKSYTFTGTNQSVPAYVSQDFEGRLVFYPQPIVPFQISFVHDVAPQELTAFDDVPAGLPPEYHEWIAWHALMLLGRYDKDPDLFAYGQDMATTYRKRAERSLLPIPSYSASPYNRVVYR